MIYKQTRIKIVDNSGAKLVRIFHAVRYPTSQHASQSGDIVVGSVIKFKPNKKIAKKQICKVLLITSKKSKSRKNGIRLKSDENRGILVDQQKLMGTRLLSGVSKEVKRTVYGHLLGSVDYWV